MVKVRRRRGGRRRQQIAWVFFYVWMRQRRTSTTGDPKMVARGGSCRPQAVKIHRPQALNIYIYIYMYTYTHTYTRAPGTAGTGRKPSTAAASGERQSRRQAVAVAKVMKAANSNRRAPHASDTPVPSPHAAAWEGGHHRSGPLPRRAGKGPGPAIGDLSKALPRRAAGGHAFAIGFDTPNDAWGGRGVCYARGGEQSAWTFLDSRVSSLRRGLASVPFQI